MPAPERPTPYQNFNSAISVPKGIVGVYTDAEVDALLANLAVGGGGTVDLSAYATTAYVDGKIATVYSKAEVDAAIAAAISALPAPADLTGLATQQYVDDAISALPATDLTGYATTDYVDAAIADPANHPATDLTNYYTKPEVDQALANAATGGTVDLSSYATQQYVDDAVAALPPPTDLTGYATEQFVTDAVSAIPAPDLSAYAKLTDPQQTVKSRVFDASVLWLRPFPDPGTGIVGAVGVTDLGAGLRLGVSYDGKAPTQLAWTTDLDAKADQATTYTKTEVDALLADLAEVAPGSPITVHETGQVPQPTTPTPAALEDAFKDYADGIHYWKEVASLVAISRQQYQTTIVVNGTVRSVARIIKSDAGLPTPQNPSVLINSDADGRWMKLTSDQLDTPFGNPQMVDLFALSGGGPQDLTGYALKDDDTQVISAAVIRALRHEFNPNAALAWEEVNGTARPVYKAGTKTFPLAFTTEIGGGSVDLSAYAKLEDNQQSLVAKTVVSSAYGFGDSLLPPVALGYVDTGEGYGNRLVLNVGQTNEYLVYRSDLDPLNALLPRIESLENKSAPPEIDLSGYADRATVLQQGQKIDALVSEAGIAATERGSHAARLTALELAGGSTVDVSAFAKLSDTSQTIVASIVEANRFRWTAEQSLILLNSGGQERPVYRNGTKNNPLAFSSELAAYCTIADAATQISLCAKKADTYTKDEVDAKIPSLATYAQTTDVATFVEANYAPKTTTYTKAEVDDLIARTPSPMRYLQWGGAFQKMTMGSGNKDKWVAAGLIPSIQIVKGKHYRLEFTMKMGQINTDIQMAWVGFRFNYRSINELPCTKEPLVNIGGWGTTTVLRDRPQIAGNPVATTNPTRADRFRLCFADDWASTSDIIEYAVEFEADRDIASANFVPEFCAGGTWGTFPADITGMVAVFRQMD